MILTVFKPWRNIEMLKSSEQTWANALTDFLDNSPRRYRDIISSIQHYHRCKNSAENEKVDDATAVEEQNSVEAFAENEPMDIDENTADEDDYQEHNITMEDIEHAEDNHINARDRSYVAEAICIARNCKVFERERESDEASHSVCRAEAEDLVRLALWCCHLQGNQDTAIETLDNDADVENSSLTMDPSINVNDDPTVMALPFAEPTIDSLHPDELLTEQRRAFDIVAWHVQSQLRGDNPEQLLMQIHGEGGTGKSRVIQTITSLFERLGVERWLAKAAYTGIAASLIGGDTTHRIAGLSFSRRIMTSHMKALLETKWSPLRYLILDEISMISKRTLAEMSRNISEAKAASSVSELCQLFA